MLRCSEKEKERIIYFLSRSEMSSDDNFVGEFVSFPSEGSRKIGFAVVRESVLWQIQYRILTADSATESIVPKEMVQRAALTDLFPIGSEVHIKYSPTEYRYNVVKYQEFSRVIGQTGIVKSTDKVNVTVLFNDGRSEITTSFRNLRAGKFTC